MAKKTFMPTEALEATSTNINKAANAKIMPKTKAQQIKDRRPKQVGIHFTEEEKYAMEDARTLAKRLGLPNATVEDFCHSLIVAGLRSIENNNDLLLRIMQEDTTLVIS